MTLKSFLTEFALMLAAVVLLVVVLAMAVKS